jgi:parallel beta-helix repeat protein
VRASIDNCRAERNQVFGFWIWDNAKVTIKRSIASGNAYGFYVTSSVAASTAELNCDKCISSNNSIGFYVEAASGAATMRVSHSTATNNTSNGFLQINPGLFESLGNNLVRGNGANTSGTITVVGAQ